MYKPNQAQHTLAQRSNVRYGMPLKPDMLLPILQHEGNVSSLPVFNSYDARYAAAA